MKYCSLALVLLVASTAYGQSGSFSGAALSAKGGPRINHADKNEYEKYSEAIAELASKHFKELKGLSEGERRYATLMAVCGKIPDGAPIFQPAATVTQILGPEDMLVRFGDKMYMIRGLSTAGLTTDSIVTDHKTFYVAESGTQTYETILGGVNTVKVWKVVSTPAAVAVSVRLKKLVRTREWPQVGEAAFVDMKNKRGRSVILLEKDGKEVELAYTALTKEDREWVRDFVKSHKRK